MPCPPRLGASPTAFARLVGRAVSASTDSRQHPDVPRLPGTRQAASPPVAIAEQFRKGKHCATLSIRAKRPQSGALARATQQPRKTGRCKLDGSKVRAKLEMGTSPVGGHLAQPSDLGKRCRVSWRRRSRMIACSRCEQAISAGRTPGQKMDPLRRGACLGWSGTVVKRPLRWLQSGRAAESGVRRTRPLRGEQGGC